MFSFKVSCVCFLTNKWYSFWWFPLGTSPVVPSSNTMGPAKPKPALSPTGITRATPIGLTKITPKIENDVGMMGGLTSCQVPNVSSPQPTQLDFKGKKSGCKDSWRGSLSYQSQFCQSHDFGSQLGDFLRLSEVTNATLRQKFCTVFNGTSLFGRRFWSSQPPTFGNYFGNPGQNQSTSDWHDDVKWMLDTARNWLPSQRN